jgi:succinyl-diaminopimelate desuccinylase
MDDRWRAVVAGLPEQDRLEYLSRVLAIPSPSGQEGPLAEFVARSMRAMGLETRLEETLPDRPAVVARLPGSGRGPSLMLLAHLDVPPVASGWTGPPLQARMRGGRVYGAGIRDMKGGLASMVMAMRALHDARVTLPGDLLFVAVPGHMEQGVGARRLFEAGVRADMVVVGEPTGLGLLGTHLGWVVLELVVRGRTTSTVTAGPGATAVQQMARVIEAVGRLRFSPAGIPPYVRRLLPGVTARAGLTVLRAGDPFRPNIVPDECALTVDLRFVPGQKPGAILRAIQARLAALRRQDPTLRVTMRKKYGFVLEPVVSRPDEPLFRAARDAVRAVRGAEPPLQGFRYTTDGGVFQRGGRSATVVCGPGNPPLFAANEWLPVREYREAIAVYVHTALAACGRTRQELAAAHPA